MTEHMESTERSVTPNFRVIAVTSGKGGVGKTNIVANLGIAFAQGGRKVLILDADLGLANVELIMGATPEHDLRAVLNDEMPIKSVISKGPDGVDLLSGSNGASEIAEISANQKWSLLQSLEPLSDTYDTLLIDTGAGIGSNVQFFAGAAQEVSARTRKPGRDTRAPLRAPPAPFFPLCLFLLPRRYEARYFGHPRSPSTSVQPPSPQVRALPPR